MKPLGPYKLSATNPQPITVEWDSLPQPSTGVDIQNVSSLLLQVKLASGSVWLLPWTARYFPLPAGAGNVVVLPTEDLAAVTGDPLTLLATVYQIGDVIPPPGERGITGLAALSAIEGTVPVENAPGNSLTIAGTVDIGSTANVAITGTPTVQFAAGQTVNIGNTPSVSITGTPTVNIGANQSVSISGTPSVSVTSGSIDINAGTVQVENTTNGVISTFVKSPPALGTVALSYAAGGYVVFTNAKLGNLAIVVVSALCIAATTNVSGTITLDTSKIPSHYTLCNPSATINWSVTSSRYFTACWVFYGIVSESDIGPSFQVTVSGTNFDAGPPIGTGSFTCGSGSNNGFSNPSLTGVVVGPISWSSTGTSNSNLTLPSTSPGVMVGAIATATNTSTPSYSIGQETLPGSSGLPALWIASSQTGELSVQSSTDPDNNTNYNTLIYGEYGLVIPQ